MTLANDPAAVAAEERAADLVLARIHLRLGSLGLARAELEAMAGRNQLDIDGIRDLAEARWRTGDLAGAGDAASAYLEQRPDDPLALLISAEMQSHLGRPGEARRIAARVIEQNNARVDEMFAGMPRSSVWPAESGAASEPAGTLFDDVADASSWLGAGLPSANDVRMASERSDSGDPGVAPAEPAAEPDGPRLWDHAETAAPTLPDASELLARARKALDAERPGQAAASLSLAIRAEPSLAPAVLDLLAGRQEPVLALVRGDSHRIVGHEAEALRDYVAAVAAIGMERSSDSRRRGKSAKRSTVEPALDSAPTDPPEPKENP
jgi:hypothetical protein